MNKPTEKHKFVKIVGKGHSKCMVEHISECWAKECYSNVKFICKTQAGAPVGKALLANKAVLAASSPTLGFILSETGEEDVTIIIPESDYNVVKMLLQYIYHGEVITVDKLKSELETFMLDWDVTYPQITVASNDDLEEQSIVLFQNMQSSPVSNSPAGFQPLAGTGNNVIEVDSSLTDPTHSEQPPCIDLPIDTDFDHTVTVPKSFDEPIQRSRTTTSKKPNSGAKKSNASKEPDNADPLALTDSTSVTVKESSRKLLKPRSKTLKAKKPTDGGSERNPIDLTAMEDGGLSNEAMDTEEDKGDEILSKAFLNEEKAHQKKLNQSINDLKGSITRHQFYVKHFLGSSALPPPIQSINRNNSKKVSEVVPKIPCVTCGKMINRKYMKTHMSVHSSERPFLCEQCGATFARTDSLKHHIRFSHPIETEVHPCTLCDKTFTKRYYLQLHMSIHTGQKRYSCSYCDKSFRRLNGLLRHKRTHTGERPYECPTCHRKFSARSNYVAHLRTHQKKVRSEDLAGNTYAVDAESQLLKCPFCETKFHREQAYLIHVAAHTGEYPKLPCRYCSETFPSNKLLTKHAWDKHADSLFKCDQCPRMFMTQPCLNNHKDIHTGEKRFSCEDCDKQFRNKVLLKNHRVSMHSTERPFSCRFCSKSFKSSMTCRTHERIHTGERPFKCPHCVKSFRQDTHLANHILIHTGEKAFVCEICNKAFRLKNNCNEHMKIHTGEKNQCATCGQVFRSVVKLRRHESTHNPNDEVEGNEEDDSLGSSEEDEED